MDQRLVPQEHAGDDQADQIGRQNRFAFGGGRQAAKEEQDEENEFDFRLADARRAQRVMMNCGPLGHEPKHHARHDDEDQQPEVEIGKDEAERQHRPEVVDEARGQNRFAQRRFVLPLSIITA